MAKRRKAKRSGFRRASRSAPKKASRRKSTKQMLPLSMEEHAYDFAAGSIIGPLSEFTKPVQQKYLGAFGSYSDEAAVGIISGLTHKFVKNNTIKKVAKEVYRGAVFSTGQQAGSDVVRGLLSRFTNSRSGNANASGTRTLR